MAKIIVVQNTKGGVGKSAISAIIARYLHHLGVNVALVDSGSQLTNVKQAQREEEEPAFPIIPMVASDQDTLIYHLKPLDKIHDVLVIDTNSNIAASERDTFASLADVLVIPLVADESDIQTTIDHLAAIENITLDKGVKVLGVVNKVTNTKVYKEGVLSELNGMYGMKVLDTVIRLKPVDIQNQRKHTCKAIDDTLLQLVEEIKTYL